MGNITCQKRKNSDSSINNGDSSRSYIDAGVKSGETLRYPVEKMKEEPDCLMQLDQLSPTTNHNMHVDMDKRNIKQTNGEMGNITCLKRRHYMNAGVNSGETYPVAKMKKKPDCLMQLEHLFPTTNHTELVDQMDKRNNSDQAKSCLQPEVSEKSKVEPSTSMGNISSTKQRLSDSSKNYGASLRHNPGARMKFEETYPIEMLKKEPDCHMQLDKLLPTTNHTVLIDTNLFLHDKINPYIGHRTLEHYHVKLPHFLNHWTVIEKRLQSIGRGVSSVQDLAIAIKSYNGPYSREWHFDALQTYVKAVSKYENNFSPVISKMAHLAQRLPNLIGHAIPLLKRGHNHAITMSQEQIACLLANAFFCTFPYRSTNKSSSEYSTFPTINFHSLFGEQCPRKTEKLRALFHYFETVTNKDTKPNGLVTFERICIPQSQLPRWESQKETLTNLHVSSKGSIEKEGKGMLQVDFACKFIGGGVLGRGLVQEEIRFLQCPELIVARLFTEKLDDNECLKITGVQKYSNTAGYSDTFEWNGPHIDDTKRDEWQRLYCQIVAIDALNFKSRRDQYNERSIKRELNKAYIGFRRDSASFDDYTCAVATGNWGCGAFNGDPNLKALIQLMAAAVARREVAFFTFGNVQQAHDLQKMHCILRTRNVTVGTLYKLLRDYNQNQHGNVFDYIRDNAKGPHLSQL